MQFPAPIMPSQEELDAIACSRQFNGMAVAATILEDYFCESANYLVQCGIRPGAMLRLKNGGLILVGHVSERLGYEDDARFVELDEIAEIGYVY